MGLLPRGGLPLRTLLHFPLFIWLEDRFSLQGHELSFGKHCFARLIYLNAREKRIKRGTEKTLCALDEALDSTVLLWMLEAEWDLFFSPLALLFLSFKVYFIYCNFKRIYSFKKMCMCAFPACISVYYIGTWSLWRSNKGIGNSGNRVTGDWTLVIRFVRRPSHRLSQLPGPLSILTFYLCDAMTPLLALPPVGVHGTKIRSSARVIHTWPLSYLSNSWHFYIGILLFFTVH